jgi:hypothetical protein
LKTSSGGYADAREQLAITENSPSKPRSRVEPYKEDLKAAKRFQSLRKLASHQSYNVHLIRYSLIRLQQLRIFLLLVGCEGSRSGAGVDPAGGVLMFYPLREGPGKIPSTGGVAAGQAKEF